jgi:succinoglycan biosynthesis transport protein ExoP
MANVTRLSTPYSQLPVEAPPPLPPGPPPKERGGGGDSVISVRQIFGTLRRHKLLIGGLALMGTVIAWLIANQMQPMYRAEATLAVEPKDQSDPSKIGAQAVYVGAEFVSTEAKKMTAPLVAEVTARHLRLIENPAYNPVLAPPPPSRIKAMFAPVRQLLGLAPPPDAVPRVVDWKETVARMTPAEQDVAYTAISRAVSGCLTAISEMGHRIITLRCVSVDPKAAADIVNKTIDTYLEQQADEISGVLREQLKTATLQVEEARQKIVASERALTEFRAQIGLFGVEDNTTTLQKNANELRIQYNTAEAAAAAIETQITKGVVPTEAGGALEAGCATARAKLGEAEAVLGPGHPRYIAAQQEVAKTCGQLAALQKTAVEQNRNKALSLRATAEQIKKQLDEADVKVANWTTNAISLKTLQTEVESSKSHYTNMLQRLQMLENQASQQVARQARRLSVAEPNRSPFSPRKDLITLVAFVASLALGVGLAIVIELMDSGFRSIHQLEEQSGVPVLGMVPFQSTRMRRNVRPWLNVVDKPNSAYSEALRTIRTGIQLTSAESPHRTVVVTSSVPGEGKTTTAISLAAASAVSGARTLIIDCDMRQPSLHTNIGVDNDVGLSEFLSGQRSLEEVVRVEPRTGLYYILAGRRPPSPTDLLGGLRMQRLLQQLGDAFEMVVMDTPPIMAVSDALLLVRSADATLFVVRWEKTRRDVATAGIKMVYEAGARLAGLVLTQVDLRRHAQYDYTDSHAYYYRGYKRYYTE